jgi:methyl-accepting chemotaxis protein
MNTTRRSLGSFRIHLALTSAISTLTFCALIAAATFVPLMAELAEGDPRSELSRGVAAHMLRMHESFWPVSLAALIASIGSAVLLFERMKAPMLRFAAAYRSIAAGRMPRPLVIRQLDYLQDEAQALNGMIAALDERFTGLRAADERIRELLEELELLDPAPGAAVMDRIARLNEAEKALRAQLCETAHG